MNITAVKSKLKSLGVDESNIPSILNDVHNVISFAIADHVAKKLPKSKLVNPPKDTQEWQTLLAENNIAPPTIQELEQIVDETWQDYFKAMEAA